SLLYLGLVGRRVGSSRYTSRTGSPMTLLSQAAASSPAGAAARSLSHTLTGTRPAPAGTGTVRSGSPGLDSVTWSSPSLGVTRIIFGCSRAVTGAPSASTTIQRRSPASPHGSTAADASRSPRHDLTGYRQTSVTCSDMYQYWHPGRAGGITITAAPAGRR